MAGKLRGVKTLREKAGALVAAELAASLFRKRRRVQRIRVSSQIFHLLGTEPEWRELIELDSELEGNSANQLPRFYRGAAHWG